MNWQLHRFDSLSTKILYDLLQLRSEVFVVEQDCVYQDIDGLDQKAFHLVGYDEDTLVGYARFFEPNIYFEEASIGRVIIKETHRDKQLGHELMKQCLYFVEANLGKQAIRISAQVHLTAYYQKHGFVSQGETYLEDGIPHIQMLRE